MPYWVYILRCGDGSLYTGITNCLERRLLAHSSGRGAKYTRGRGPVELVYRAYCPDKPAALRRELAIKGLRRQGKIALIGGARMEEIYGGLLGLCVADALGVPVEFQSRGQLARNPVTGMRSGGTYGLGAGSWSDDSSMTFCLADSIAETGGIDGKDIMSRFLSWIEKGAYTPHGEMFDIGIATRKALARFAQGTPPEDCGCTGERENGNGSLMRILPLAFYLKSRHAAGMALEDAMEAIHRVSALTHAHPRSLTACGLYVCAAMELGSAASLKEGLERGMTRAADYYRTQPLFAGEMEHAYWRIGDLKALAALPEEEISSDGYVVSTLEAALWCLLNTDSYQDCVLRAVNLGSDTDTVAAVAGGLAGIFYGRAAIPEEWLAALARRTWIESLCRRLAQQLGPESGM